MDVRIVKYIIIITTVGIIPTRIALFAFNWSWSLTAMYIRIPPNNPMKIGTNHNRNVGFSLTSARFTSAFSLNFSAILSIQLKQIMSFSLRPNWFFSLSRSVTSAVSLSDVNTSAEPRSFLQM